MKKHKPCHIVAYVSRISKSGRDRFSGIMRYAASRDDWNVRVAREGLYTTSNNDSERNAPPDGIIGHTSLMRDLPPQQRKGVSIVSIDCRESNKGFRIDAEMFIDQDAAMFAKVFGADAVIFSVIDVWKKNGFGIDTKIKYSVKSTTTNEILFDRTCDLYLDLRQNSTNSALVNLAATLITTAVTDHIVAARKCNKYIFSDIPRGKYSPSFMNDQNIKASKKDTKVTVK